MVYKDYITQQHWVYSRNEKFKILKNLSKLFTTLTEKGKKNMILCRKNDVIKFMFAQECFAHSGLCSDNSVDSWYLA